MKVHKDLISYNLGEDVLNKATELGMDVIDYDRRYIVKKTGEKNPSPHGYASEGAVIRGYPYLIGNKNDVALFFESDDEWFKTSAIIKMNKDLTFETLNSYYKLQPVLQSVAGPF